MQTETEEPQVLHFHWIVLSVIVAPLGLILLLFLYVVPDPELPEDALERSQVLIQSGAHIAAARTLQEHLEERVFDVEYNRAFLVAHFMLPEYVGQGRKVRDDRPVLTHYDNLCRSNDPRTRAFGCYYYGLYFAHQDQNDRAMNVYDQIENGLVPYLDFSRAMVHAKRGNYEKAVELLRREIGSGADLEIVIAALSNSLVRLKDWSALRDLMKDPKLAEFVSQSARQTYRLVHGDVIGYVSGYRDLYFGLLIFPLILAIVGIGIWLWLLRWWTAMHQWQWPAIGFTLLSGAAAAHLVFFAHDAIGLVFDLGFRGDYVQDFLFAVLFIGLVEETVKFLPVAILALPGNFIKKPVDWMIFAGVSGLGFGALEGYIYLADYGHSIAIGRLFISLPLHVLLSAGIGIAVGESARRGRSPYVVFACALALAALVHGVFDYMLIGPVPLLRMFAFYTIILITMAFLYGRDGILVLSGYGEDPDREMIGAKPQTLWGFAGFAVLNIVTAILAGMHLPDSELLKTTFFHGLFCLGPIFTVFLLSSRPAPVQWLPGWYRLSRAPAELSEEQTQDYREQEINLQSRIESGTVSSTLFFSAIPFIAAAILIKIGIDESIGIDPEWSRPFMIPAALVFMCGGIAPIFSMLRTAREISIDGDTVSGRNFLSRFHFDRSAVCDARASSTGITLILNSNQKVRISVAMQRFGKVMDQLLPPLSEISHENSRKIVLLRENSRIWKQEIEEPGTQAS